MMLDFSSNTHTRNKFIKITSKIIKAFAIDQSIEAGELCYILSGDKIAVRQSDLEVESDITQNQIDELAEGIAEKIKQKFSKLDNGNFKFEVENISELIAPKCHILFRDLEDKQKFYEEFKKLVKKYNQPLLQKVFDRNLSLINNSSESPNWTYPDISSDKIIETAKNLEIDIEKFLKSREGKIAGKDYGI